MASQSTHTEPARPHTKDELMHPGRHHHQHHTSSGEMACPDPSAHGKDSRLQEQASTAALYATSPNKRDNADQNPLDKDGKLSSRSAAMSLKHARAEDLPGFPVVGINTNSAGGAALLANKNHKGFEHWKPDPSMSASAAALAAKDYKMAPLWQPELSAAGSKAALLAAKDGGKLDLWMPSATAEGNSAATQAMRNKGLSPQIFQGSTPDNKNKALLAATGAVGKARSNSIPVAPSTPKYPDAVNSAHNALNAATVAHRPSTRSNKPSDRMDSEAMEAARIKHISSNIPKEMWTERPPVEIELEEKRHNAALRASAVSMAKQMYTYQQQHSTESQTSHGGMGATAAVKNSAKSQSSASPDLRTQAVQYIHLQEAAQKLAEERLAKLDPDAAARFREHYGYPTTQARSRLSMRGRGRRRAGSEVTADADSSDDEFQARRIRNQMAGLNKNLASADEEKRKADDEKRKTDRASLLAAAEKKVHAQMHSMDEKVFAETGKVSPAMMEEWEAKARAKAAKDSNERMVHHGKTNIGGGRYMDQSEIEAIAAARLKPTLDEINTTAEKRRARDEELRLAAEEKQREVEGIRNEEKITKIHDKQAKDEEKTLAKQKRAEEKAAERERKMAAKTEKEAEKARKSEEKRLAKEDKRRSKDVRKDQNTAITHPTNVVPATEDDVDQRPSTPSNPNRESISSDSSILSEDSAEGAPLEKHESLMHQYSPTGERELKPEIERHVTDLGNSASDLDSEDEAPAHRTEVPVSSTLAHDVIARVAAAPVEAVSTKPGVTDAPVIPLTTEVVADAPIKVISTKQEGTDAEIGRTNEGASGVNKPKKLVKESRTSPADDLTKSTQEGAADTTPQTYSVSSTKADSAPVLEEPKSPGKSGGFGRLFNKLKRRSQAPPTKSEEPKDVKPSAPTISEPSAVTTAKSTQPTASEKVLPKEALATATGIESAGRASPSSFRRHGADAASISSLSSSGKEEEGVPAMLTRGRQGQMGPRKSLDRMDSNLKSDGEDEFEEARDTFDETLAPPPSFGGQAKSSSPVRETKFQENL